jgi:hypothetical protein
MKGQHLMGDRALVIFHDDDRVSPTVYLHWDGSRVPERLEQLKKRMEGRENDADYAAARFIGICHEHIPGNLSLGVFGNPYTLAELKNGSRLAEASHGDAGVIVVNTKDFHWRAYGGYLTSHKATKKAAA